MENIKVYNDLSNEQKGKVYEFMRLETNLTESFEQMDNMFSHKLYDYGKGVIFYFIETEVVSSLSIVLEVASKLHTAYIHKIIVNKEIPNIDKILELLIQQAVLISKEYGANDIRIGVGEDEDEVLNELEEIGFKMEYKSFEMKLSETSKKCETLELKELTLKNKDIYVEIYNKSFSDMPHGTITDIDSINNIFSKEKDNNKLEYRFIVNDKDSDIGFMEVTIENDKGMFDIGLCKEYRGIGYGTRLLETAIQFLVDKKVKEIALIVIAENQRAYNLYKKRGFEVNHVIGHWSKV
ncbi:MAG: GNAT family N-acetyltransferase [Romboutsia sp.]|uniref:GNAT family N-acetyltransferase n=1 Tax=Romboutsia sp. TaxID=1965302 RepID=UPI003F3AAF52